MSLLLEFIPGARNEDKERFIKFYTTKINKGDITDYVNIFDKTKKKVKLLKAEKAAEEEKKKMSELQVMLMQKHKERQNNDIFDVLIDKYSNPKKNPKELKKKSKAEDKKPVKKVKKL